MQKFYRFEQTSTRRCTAYASCEKSFAVYSSTYKCVWFVYETLIVLLSNSLYQNDLWETATTTTTIEGLQREEAPFQLYIIVHSIETRYDVLRTICIENGFRHIKRAKTSAQNMIETMLQQDTDFSNTFNGTDTHQMYDDSHLCSIWYVFQLF